MTQTHLGKSIAQLSVLIQSGSLDPVALAEESLDAIRAYGDQAIFTRVLETRAKEEAAASSRPATEIRALPA